MIDGVVVVDSRFVEKLIILKLQFYATTGVSFGWFRLGKGK